MATAIKTCRVCGKEYPACRSLRPNDGVFRWQEVACSPECGAKYLSMINASRGIVGNNAKDNTAQPERPARKRKKKIVDQGDEENTEGTK